MSRPSKKNFFPLEEALLLGHQLPTVSPISIPLLHHVQLGMGQGVKELPSLFSWQWGYPTRKLQESQRTN